MERTRLNGYSRNEKMRRGDGAVSQMLTSSRLRIARRPRRRRLSEFTAKPRRIGTPGPSLGGRACEIRGNRSQCSLARARKRKENYAALKSHSATSACNGLAKWGRVYFRGWQSGRAQPGGKWLRASRFDYLFRDLATGRINGSCARPWNFATLDSAFESEGNGSRAIITRQLFPGNAKLIYD